ncbi:MAG: hypothetical protein ACOCVN_00855 [bacterium]
MKTIIILYLLLICSITQSQSDNEEIKKVFTSYRNLIEQKKYDEAFDYYHEGFLKYVPKEDLKKQFTNMNSSDKFEYKVTGSKLVFISSILTKDTMKYAYLKYGALYLYTLNKNLDQGEVEKIKTLFENQYGEDYSYHEQKREISFYKEQELIALNDDNWKFIPNKKKRVPYMSNWVPGEIFNMLMVIKDGENKLESD